MLEPGLPIFREELTSRFDALLVADSLSIFALKANSDDLASPIAALDVSLKWLAGLFSSLSQRRDAMARISNERLNATLPVMRSLFPDVFPMVIEYLQAIEKKDRRVRNLTWARVSHVCTQWRRTSLGLATIWARDPTVLGARGFECVLARTNGLPIDITVDDNCPIPLQDALRRTRTLISPKQNHFDYEILSIQALPELEKLVLDRPYLDYGEVLPRELAAHPRLRTVKFISTYISILPVMKSLVDLRLDFVPAHRFTSAELMAVLQAAPLLCNLIVSRNEGYHGEIQCPPSSSFPAISLPRLQHISLKGFCLCETCHVFGHLPWPHMIEARALGNQHHREPVEKNEGVLPLLLTLSSVPTFAVDLTCRIEHHRGTSYMTLVTPDGRLTQVELFHADRREREGPLVEAMNSLVASAFSARIRAIGVSVADLWGITAQVWKRFFTPLEAATQVVVQLFGDSSPSYDQLGFLALVDSISQSDNSGLPAGPNIRTFTLRAGTRRLDLMWYTMSRLASDRRKHGMPLDKVEFIGGTMAGFDEFVCGMREVCTLEFIEDREARCVVFN